MQHARQRAPYAIDVINSLERFGTLCAPAGLRDTGDRGVADIPELAAFGAQQQRHFGQIHHAALGA